VAETRRRKSPFVIFLFILIVCILCSGAIWAVDQIPALAEREFGPASPSLGVADRVYYSTRLLAAHDELLQPVGTGENSLGFEIKAGESANSIILRLELAGIIPSAEHLRDYIVYAGLDTGIQAGKYAVNDGMSPVEIAQLLQSAPTEAVLVILPGWRAEEVAAALPTTGLAISAAEFIQAVRNPPSVLVPASLQPLSSLEGYLFPGEYRLPREATLEDLIIALLERFNSNVTLELRDAFANNGLTLNEAVILASIVQRESMDDEEMAMIASVFYNRLAIGMKLDSDPTVQYAVGYNKTQQTWWTNPLDAEQLNLNSPYNTYIINGLPPGAICNPGISALQAVAYPAKSPYYYFQMRCDDSGLHEFAVTYEEHLGNACP